MAQLGNRLLTRSRLRQFEVAHFGFNAVLRDYARLGRLLAHDGAWGDKQIIPAQWMLDASSASTGSYLAPGNAMPMFGYGYLLWLLPGPHRQFAMAGALGQRVCVDPASKLVMVQTALEDTPEVWDLWRMSAKQFGSWRSPAPSAGCRSNPRVFTVISPGRMDR